MHCCRVYGIPYSPPPPPCFSKTKRFSRDWGESNQFRQQCMALINGILHEIDEINFRVGTKRILLQLFQKIVTYGCYRRNADLFF
jgi:hypothetical protein